MNAKALKSISLCAGLAFWLAGASLATASTVTGTYSNDADSGNQATGFPIGPFGLTSTATTYSYVDFIPDQTFTYSQIQSIGATFSDTAGGADAGSPRLFIGLNTGGWILTYLGTPPGFADSNSALFTATFSGANLNNGTNNSAYENGNTYSPFSSFNALYGGDTVTDVALIIDSGWAANGPEALTLDSINIEISSAATPLPSTWLMLLSGFVGLGFFAYRGTKKNAAALAAA
jgi:hypothetical protein